MRLLRKLAGRLCTLSLLVPSLAAQSENACLQPALIVNVVGNNGSLPGDLKKDDFRVTYHGRGVTVTNLNYTEGPRRVIILLDTSGSMSGQSTGKSDTWQIARAAVWELVASLPARSKTSLATFSDKTQTEVPLSADRKPIQEWLNRETTRHPESLRGQTALYKAILAGAKALEPTEPGDAIFVVTDGGENASRARLPEVEKALRTSGIRLFAFVLTGGQLGTPEELAGIEDLHRVCKNSGGFVTDLYIYKEDQVRSDAQQLSRLISGFYSLTLQLPESSTKPQHLELDVVDTGSRKRKDVALAYPRELYPCSVEGTGR